MKTMSRLLFLFVLIFGVVACDTIDDLVDKIPDPSPTQPTDPDPSDPSNPDPSDPNDPTPPQEQPDDPSLRISTTGLTLKQGDNGEASIIIQRFEVDENEPVTLELGEVPDGLSVTLTKTKSLQQSSAVVSVSTTDKTSLKTYQVPIRASMGSLEAETTLNIAVLAPDVAKANYNSFSAGLPGWNKFVSDQGKPAKDDENRATGSAQTLPTETIGQTEYSCTTTPYTITRNPDKIVALNPDTSALWVGGLIQGEGHVNGIGSLKPLPISQRAPVTISIDLLSGNNSRTIENPTVATVQQAIGELISQAEAQSVTSGSKIFYNEKKSHSLKQVALDFGLSVNYMGASVETQLDFSNSKEETTLMAHYVHDMFTVTMVTPQTPEAFFSDTFTQEALDRQVQLGNMGPTNIPVYVSSITYGRMLTFTFTSTASEQEIKAALSASYTGGSASLNASQKKLLNEAEVQVVTVGGNESAARAVIQSGNLKDYFSSSAALSTARPISYELRNVGDNSIAKISETTNYNITECTASPVDIDPIGAQVQVRLESITVHDACDSGGNGSDGEIYGRILVDGQEIWNLPSSSTRKTSDGEIISLNQSSAPQSILFSSSDRIRIEGFVKDKDPGNDDDIANWNFTVNPFSYSARSNRSSPDCSATLRYRVVKLQDIFPQ